ncbi:CPBP family intramembrane glutamic endopeptidase, partial [Halobium palmae]
YGEEAGWRGYLLPRLQSRWGALTASLLPGVVWFLWHVPLLFLPGDTNGAMPLPLMAAFVVASSVMYTWLYNSTGGSVLAVTLLHGGFDVWNRFIASHPSNTGDPISGLMMVGVETPTTSPWFQLKADHARNLGCCVIDRYALCIQQGNSDSCRSVPSSNRKHALSIEAELN